MQYNNIRELFSRSVHSRGRKYYINVKENDYGPYLVIREVKINQDGTRQSFEIMLFPDDFAAFIDSLSICMDFADSRKKQKPSNSRRPGKNYENENSLEDDILMVDDFTDIIDKKPTPPKVSLDDHPNLEEIDLI